jgi:hypothetical protein
MTTLLSIPAQVGAPMTCGLTPTGDPLTERLAAYRRLFDHALTGRESTATTARFRLAARPGVQDELLHLVRREAVCCPFLSYDVSRDGEQLVWTLHGPDVAVLVSRI